MPENLSEISGYSFTETSTSNRDRSANHRKNNKTENFSQNSYVKPIEFQLFGTFSRNAILRGDIFSPFFQIYPA